MKSITLEFDLIFRKDQSHTAPLDVVTDDQGNILEIWANGVRIAKDLKAYDLVMFLVGINELSERAEEAMFESRSQLDDAIEAYKNSTARMRRVEGA